MNIFNPVYFNEKHRKKRPHFMSKRKLTQNQTRRIQSNNAKALHRHKKKEVEWQDDMLGESQDGVVVLQILSTCIPLISNLGLCSLLPFKRLKLLFAQK